MQHPNALRVSVVIPVFYAGHLADCLASVYEQTRPPDEVIVVDDGSPDRALLETATREHPGVRVLQQPNAGAGAARNRGIAAARADLIAFLDADDAWYPDLLETQLRQLHATGATLAYANGRIVGHSALAGRLFMDGAPSRGEVTVASLLAQECTVLTSSVVALRAALIDAGLFDPTLRRGQDFDLWVRLAHRGARFTYTSTPLLDRRVHGENLSGAQLDELQRAVGVLENFPRKLSLSPTEQAILRRRTAALRGALSFERGKQCLLEKDVTGARTAFLAAAHQDGSWKSRAAAGAMLVAPGMTRWLYVRKRRAPSSAVVTPPAQGRTTLRGWGGRLRA